MASLVEELQSEAIDRSVPISALLRKAKLVAAKLGTTDAASWIQHELNGYPEGAELPSYRQLTGEPRYRHPYYGWLPLRFGDPDDHRKASETRTRQPVSELEEMLERTRGDGAAMCPYPPQLTAKLAKNLGIEIAVAGTGVGSHQLARILDDVRTRVLDWALELERAGVRGDGVSFSIAEQQRASGVTFHIGTAGTVVGAVAGNLTSHATLGVTPEQLKAIVSLAAQVRTLAPTMDLSEEQAGAIERVARDLEAEAKTSSPSGARLAALLASLKGVAESAGGSLLAAGVMEMIKRLGLIM